MIIGEVISDYVIFVTNNIVNIEEHIDSVCTSLYLEAKLKSMGFQIKTGEEDQWEF